ncbi:10341_t:CDS:1, partial [Dentiscutata heterogama]
LDDHNDNSNSFELDSTDNLLDGLENSLQEYQEFSNKLLNDSAFTEEIQNSSDNDE